jgi:hypothetical protein
VAIVGGFDIHRRQITFDYLDTVTGQERRGRISPARRATLRAWLERFTGCGEVTFAVEGCTGWRFVVEELQRAGITALVAEPAETAHRRGPKRRAKTDKTDARHLRVLVAEDRVPRSWIPPEQVMELRALLQLYTDLREEHTAWAQRIHATLLHQGVPGLAGQLPDPRVRARLADAPGEVGLPAAGAQAVQAALRQPGLGPGIGGKPMWMRAAHRERNPQVIVEHLIHLGQYTRPARQGDRVVDDLNPVTLFEAAIAIAAQVPKNYLAIGQLPDGECDRAVVP